MSVEKLKGNVISNFEENVNQYINFLVNFQELENVFNPWKDIDGKYDSDDACKIRQKNLRTYLMARKKAKYVLVAEAPGYQGCHFSGIPMTSERIITTVVDYKDIFKGMERSSDPEKLDNKSKIVKIGGFCEPTATIIWKKMVSELSISPEEFVLWNTFPFHPYEGDDLLSNRTPNSAELGISRDEKALKFFLKLFPDSQIIAIGEKAKNELAILGYRCHCVRHPANGGATCFRNGLNNIFNNIV